LTEESKNRAPSEDDAWLEQALLLAAAELSAFRASAQAERDRLLRAQEAVRSHAQALEEQLRETESRHAAELSEARSQLELQQNDRAKAWGEFSQGLKQRIAALAGAKQQHARDLEEAGVLRDQLHQLRLQLEAAQGTNAELETRLAASEESYAVAGDAMGVAREQAAALRTQCEQLRAELTASTGSYVELQSARHAQVRKLEELEAARGETEQRVQRAQGELSSARERIAVLEQGERAAQGLRDEIEAVVGENQTQSEQLARLREQLTQAERAREAEKQSLERASAGEKASAERAREAERQNAELVRQQAEAALQQAKKAQDDVLAARRERDETTRALESKLSAELSAAQAERDSVRRELEEQTSTRWAMLDIEKQRSAKLKAELDAKNVELEPLRADRDRIAVQLRHVSAERDRIAAELQQLSGERSRLEQELQVARSLPPPARARADVDPRDKQTVPILPDMPAANAPSRPPPRQGTAYSYSEVAEEQVFVPARPPAKGGSGGRGSR
jgi:chromosome segregation ATPase